MTLSILAIAFGSIVLHDVAHAAVATALGDTTARDRGRLTLNPLAHVDPFLTVLLPAVVYLLSGGAMAIGCAKPVPIDRTRLRGRWLGYAAVIAAGPLLNVLLAALAFVAGLELVASLNLALALFNLLPLPGFDGWNLLRAARMIAKGAIA